MSETGKERWSGPANIAWCDEHGLHGCRNICFECGKPVEQIPMLPVSEHESALAKARKEGREEVREALERLAKDLEARAESSGNPAYAASARALRIVFDEEILPLDSLTKEGS